MNLTPITTVLRSVIAGVSHNSPIILTGLGVAGLIGTTVMAVQATPKALSLLDDELYTEFKRQNLSINYEDWITGGTKVFTWRKRIKLLPKKQVVKTVWKCYIPAAGMGLLTVGCIVGANRINLRRNAAIASVYSITEATLKEYQNKVTETIGETKERKIRDEIAQEHIAANPPNNNQIIITGGGDMLCFDTLSGRYFKSDLEKIRKVENKLNRDILSEMFIGVNQLYYDLGLPEIRLGDDMGWNVDTMLEFTFTSKIAENGTPCLILDYIVAPKEGYNKLF